MFKNAYHVAYNGNGASGGMSDAAASVGEIFTLVTGIRRPHSLKNPLFRCRIVSERLSAKMNGRKNCIKRNILVSYMEFDREKIEGDFQR